MSTISDVIKKDHQEIKKYAENIRTATDDDSRTRWQNQFVWELARHSIGEELVVYPAFAKHLGARGQSMANKDREEHQSVRFEIIAGKLVWRLTVTGQGRLIQVSEVDARATRIYTNPRGAHERFESTYRRRREARPSSIRKRAPER